MSAAKNHEYHLVNPSPWPLIGATAAMFLFGGMVMWFHGNRYGPFSIGLRESCHELGECGTIGVKPRRKR